nr:unnamed protein product [Callosobruchus analis]
MIEDDSDEVRMVVVDSRTADELIPIIQEWVEVVSEIHTDSWASYNGLSSHGYIHNLNGLLLPPEPLPGTDDPVPHALIGDKGFGLKTYLMRPFLRATALQDEQKANFNHRLCRARRGVGNAFGILTHKWRIFRGPMECAVEPAIDVGKATTCLHNYVIVKRGNNDIDLSQDTIAATSTTLPSINPTNKRPTNETFQMRKKIVNYFNNNI